MQKALALCMTALLLLAGCLGTEDVEEVIEDTLQTLKCGCGDETAVVEIGLTLLNGNQRNCWIYNVCSDDEDSLHGDHNCRWLFITIIEDGLQAESFFKISTQ